MLLARRLPVPSLQPLCLASKVFLGSRMLRNVRRNSFFTPVENYDSRVRPYFHFDQIRPDVFQSSHLTSPAQVSVKSAYGGLIFAQSLAAAENTVPDHVYSHSIQSHFLRNVDTRIPIEYHVRRLRDGNSFCTRGIEAVQKGHVVFCSQISFHREEPDSCVHQVQMPNVAHYSELPRARDALPKLLQTIENKGGKVPKAWKLWTQQYCSKSSELLDSRIAESSSPMIHHYWFRAAGNLAGEDSKLNKYLLAYITDAEMAVSIIRPHFENHFESSMTFSLNHCVWFHSHTNCRADEWCLMEVETPVASASRGLANSRIFNEGGKLMLSATQEVLIRSWNKVSRL